MARRRRGAVFVRRAPDPERRRFAPLWRDPERRRALLLSLLLHAGLLLGVVVSHLGPEPEPPEELIVLELTPPESAASQQEAAADADPAPQNPDTQVAGNAPETSQASLENAETEEAEIAAEATTETPPTPATPEPVPEPSPTLPEAPAPPSERPPQARVPAQAATPNLPARLPAQTPASTLPEIEAVEVAPQPPQDAIALPAPKPEAAVTPSRRVAPTPQVALSETQPVPTPAVSAAVATREVALPDVQTTVSAADAVPEPDVQAVVAADVPVPQVETVVAATEAIPQPAASAEVATEEITLPQVQSVVADADAIPQPSVRAVVAAAVPQPQIQTEVAAATVIPQPSVQAEVAAATPVPQAAAAVAAAEAVPQPQAGAVVSAAEGVPQPAVSGAVVLARDVPQPQVGTTVTEAQPLEAAPGVTLTDSIVVATPEVAVTVIPGAGAETAEAADAGDGARNLQPDAAATADAEGSAADGDGPADTGVTNVQSFEVTLEKPLAVLIDNADAAYPQQGLVEAASVFEMPVEGGLTRLMSVYTEDDPAQVGPIRSARDYFLEAALAMDGTLVHVGGAPSTVGRIASQDLVTVDALENSSLFIQAPEQPAPHSTYAAGNALRDAVGSLDVQVSGTLYTPPSDAPDAGSVTVGYSADYTSGFRYLSDLDQYRWVRNGTDAGDAAGTAVAADAVVVAQVTAFPYSGDPEGRLYLPYSGGAATLYLRGKAISGTWTPNGGFSFQSQSGTVVDLRPFKHWILFAPESAAVSVN